MLGATLAGAAFSNSSVALVHGMSRPIGAHFHLAHGLSNALLLPTVTRFSVTGRARALRAPSRARCDLAGRRGLRRGRLRAPRRGARGAQRRPGIPSLSEAGVDREHFERVVQDMAQAALDSGSPGFNPQPATKEEIVELYHQAY